MAPIAALQGRLLRALLQPGSSWSAEQVQQARTHMDLRHWSKEDVERRIRLSEAGEDSDKDLSARFDSEVPESLPWSDDELKYLPTTDIATKHGIAFTSGKRGTATSRADVQR